MKITFVCGNNRKNANTDHILNLLGKSLYRQAETRGQTLELESIHLGDHKIEMCSGCRVCFERGEAFCPHKDDITSLASALLSATW
jgi:multimeric flavodoxin WrbA